MRWLVIAALCWSAAGAAHAEPPESYDPLIAQALKEYRSGNFGEARVLFQQAHRIYPNARTFRGLAITAFELRLYVEAIVEATAALDGAERPLTDAQREELQALLRRARMYAARIELDVSPRAAAAEIDGRGAARSRDGTHLVNPGEDTVAVRAEGHVPQTRQVMSRAGSVRSSCFSSRRSAPGRRRRRAIVRPRRRARTCVWPAKAGVRRDVVLDRGRRSGRVLGRGAGPEPDRPR